MNDTLFSTLFQSHKKCLIEVSISSSSSEIKRQVRQTVIL